MSKQKETPTITMTEKQLENVIKTAVKNALHEIKDEENLPVNEKNDMKKAPASFTLLNLISLMALTLFFACSLTMVALAGYLLFKIGFNIFILLYGIAFLGFSVLSLIAMIEVDKTKSIEVMHTIFTAIMALVSLIVAIIGVVFAYKAISPNNANSESSTVIESSVDRGEEQ